MSNSKGKSGPSKERADGSSFSLQEDQEERSYYYDDSYGYTVFEEDCAPDDDENDEPTPIFTTGYTGKRIEALKPMLERLDAVLVDIRFSPNSRVMHWRKAYLSTLLKDRYHHNPNLGNRTFREGRIAIQNLELGLETLLASSFPVVLMCACKEYSRCHRRVISEELGKRGYKTKEIPTWEG